MNPEPYQLHKSFGYRITILSRINERAFESRISNFGVTRTIWCILVGVGEEGLVHPSELAAFVGIDRTATSRALGQMESRGLVRRRDGAADGRTKEVSITRRGRRVLSDCIKAARENARWFNEKLTATEIKQLDHLVNKLLQDETRAVSRL